METFAYADSFGDSFGENDHAAHDHWSMHKIRRFIEETVGLPDEVKPKPQQNSPPPPRQYTGHSHHALVRREGLRRFFNRK